MIDPVIKRATKRTWWYRFYEWLRDLFSPPYNWNDAINDIKEKENKNGAKRDNGDTGGG